MKTRTVTVREGEYLGPVDPDYDHMQGAWSRSQGGYNPEFLERGWEQILKMNASPEGWTFHSDGGGLFRVVRVGMWDGWPFWKPTPAIGYIGPLGAIEWAFYYRLNASNCRQE